MVGIGSGHPKVFGLVGKSGSCLTQDQRDQIVDRIMRHDELRITLSRMFDDEILPENLGNLIAGQVHKCATEMGVQVWMDDYVGDDGIVYRLRDRTMMPRPKTGPHALSDAKIR